MARSLDLEAAGLTDVGGRTENEDALLLDQGLGLFVVADGVGGSAAGALASRLAVETLRRRLAELRTDKDAGLVSAAGEALSPDAARLREAVLAAHAAILASGEESPERRGMASTIAAAYIQGSALTTANVGDSPIRLFRQGRALPLSTAHTVAALRAKGVSGIPETIPGHTLAQALGLGRESRPEVNEISLLDQDRLVLCSDGLSNMVSLAEMAHIVAESSPTVACRRLVDLAKERGGPDNITVALVFVQAPASCLGALIGFFRRFARRG